MNPDLPQTPREELELRITALLLGELSELEAATVRAALAQDSELAKLHDDLKQTIRLVRQAGTSAEEPVIDRAVAPKLSSERRERLLAQFKTLRPKEFAPEKRRVKFRMVEVAVVLAICALLGLVLIPNFVKARKTSQGNLIATNLRQLDSAKQQWALENNKPANVTPTFADLQSYLGRSQLPSVGNETYVLGKVGEPVSVEVDAAEARKLFGKSAAVPRSERTDRVRLTSDGDLSFADGKDAGLKIARLATPAEAQQARESLGFRTWSLGEPAVAETAPNPTVAYYSASDFTVRDAVPPPLSVVAVGGTVARSPAPQPTPIVLPPVESPAAAASKGTEGFFFGGAALQDNFAPQKQQIGQQVTFANNSGSLSVEQENLRNPLRDYSKPKDEMSQPVVAGSIVAPATGLPVAPPPAGAATLEAEPPLEVRTLTEDKQAWGLASENAGELAFRRRGGVPADDRRPRVYVSGGVGGGGGRAGEGGIATTTGSTSELSRAARDFYAAAGEGRKANEGNLALYDNLSGALPARGKREEVEEISAINETLSQKLPEIQLHARFAEVGQSNQALGFDWYAGDVVGKAGADVNGSTVVGDLPALGRHFTNAITITSRARGSVLDGGIVASMSNVYEHDVAGYANVPATLTVDNNGREQLGRLVSRGQSEETRVAERKLRELRQLADLERHDLQIRKPATNAPIPQPEMPTAENPFSTFSLNVSDVSFKLAAASLEQGQMPDPASVRSEEFINAFDYRDPEPQAGAPIAFAWERARYPFAHNRDLLRFSLKTAAAGRQAGKPLNVVLLLDNSGSMERADRVQIIREALRVLALQLQPQDKFSVITFARTPRLFADGAPGSDAGAVAMALTELTPQGGTNLEEAMNLAYQTAARHYLADGINRVVLLTDGAANLGDVEPESLKQKVEAARQQGIALDCFGIGWEGFNDDLLEVLSRNGDGRYGFINSPEEAATDFAGQLAGALQVAAADVKVQVEFNPKRVTAYRQIGYAKHQLTKEQFRDNTVDAAEIAAQEAGNALYTVEVNPAGEGPLATVRVRYKVPGTTDYREQAWDVPFTGSVGALEHSSPAMRLAASAGAFAEWLVASPFAGEVTPDRLFGYLGGVPEVYGADERPKKLEWMIRQAASVVGR